MSKEAMKLALEALKTCDVVDYQQDFDSKKVNKAITALREALAEKPAQQEQTQEAACKAAAAEGNRLGVKSTDALRIVAAYVNATTPQAQPAREWVGLTNEEIDYQAKKDDHAVYFALGALWAEAKLKDKNSGAQTAQEPVAWNVIDPLGKVVATETNAVRGWARIGGYKPTVEGLLGFHEQGWRVVPATPQAQPTPEPDQQAAAVMPCGAVVSNVYEAYEAGKKAQPAPAQQCLEHGECFGGECIYPDTQPAQQEPVAAECKFDSESEWGRCSIEHHNLVQSEPHNWPGYQTRLLYTTPQAQP